MFGSDPEFFIVDPEGKPVPAHRFFPQAGPERWIFRDGYAVEINPEASSCRALLSEGVRNALTTAQGRLPDGYVLTTRATVKIDLENDLAGAPPDVLTFGCRPSVCAYTGRAKTPPLRATEYPYRHAGGHLWISQYLPGPGPEAVAEIVRQFDLYVGLPLAVLFPTKGEFARRKFYGQAGEFRTRVFSHEYFGIEYRVPSPAVWNHPAVASMAMQAMRLTLQERRGKDRALLRDTTFTDDLRGAIDTGKGARKLLRELPGVYTPELICTLADRRAFRRFELLDILYEFHTAWDEYVSLGV